jgi:hypothetical protein
LFVFAGPNNVGDATVIGAGEGRDASNYRRRWRRLTSGVFVLVILVGGAVSAGAAPPVTGSSDEILSAADEHSLYGAAAGNHMSIPLAEVSGLTDFEAWAFEDTSAGSHLCVGASRVRIRSKIIDGKKVDIKIKRQEFGCAVDGFTYGFDSVTWSGGVQGSVPTEVRTVTHKRTTNGSRGWTSRRVRVGAATTKVDITWRGTGEPQVAVAPYSRAVVANVYRDSSVSGIVRFRGLSTSIDLPSQLRGVMGWGAAAGLCC